MKALLDIVATHKRGAPIGVYSLCSAHPLVIEAALREAKANDAPLLVEDHLEPGQPVRRLQRG
jgi:D-tagatose-1,6-bisphosphate aldolase subunit GatZ/KbaZ